MRRASISKHQLTDFLIYQSLVVTYKKMSLVHPSYLYLIDLLANQLLSVFEMHSKPLPKPTFADFLPKTNTHEKYIKDECLSHPIMSESRGNCISLELRFCNKPSVISRFLWCLNVQIIKRELALAWSLCLLLRLIIHFHTIYGQVQWSSFNVREASVSS